MYSTLDVSHRIGSCEHLGRWIVVIVLFQMAAFVDLAETGQWQLASHACSYSRGDRGLTSLQATGCLSSCGCSASGSGGSAAITLRRGAHWNTEQGEPGARPDRARP